MPGPLDDVKVVDFRMIGATGRVYLSGTEADVRQAASAAAVLLAAGTPGKRLALPHSRVLIHQPYAGAQGQVSDIELASREIQRLKTQLEEILARHTGQDASRIHDDTDRDYVMTAEEAKEYGIIDEVIDQRDLVDNSGPIAAVK